MTEPTGALSDLLTAIEAAQVLPAKPVNLPAAAMYYATRLGWPVFPCTPRGKRPLTEHGFQDASNDPAQVRRWWEQWPDANVALPTGPTSGGIGLDVIDADGPDGVQAWNAIKHRHCAPDCSREAFCNATGGFTVLAEAFTPGNSSVGRGPGRHIYVAASGRPNAARINDQPLDLRAAGGYVVAAPSVNLIGAAYVWLLQPTLPSTFIVHDNGGTT